MRYRFLKIVIFQEVQALICIYVRVLHKTGTPRTLQGRQVDERDEHAGIVKAREHGRRGEDGIIYPILYIWQNQTTCGSEEHPNFPHFQRDKAPRT